MEHIIRNTRTPAYSCSRPISQSCGSSIMQKITTTGQKHQLIFMSNIRIRKKNLRLQINTNLLSFECHSLSGYLWLPSCIMGDWQHERAADRFAETMRFNHVKVDQTLTGKFPAFCGNRAATNWGCFESKEAPNQYNYGVPNKVLAEFIICSLCCHWKHL